MTKGNVFQKMDLECSEGDCEQTCNAKTCKLNCSGGKCKFQKCYDKGDVCEMDLECSGGGQCNAKQQCKMQIKVEMCNMHCNAIDCTQTCDAVTCHISRTWPTSPQGWVSCSGNGEYCGNLISSAPSTATQGFLTQISTVQRKDKSHTWEHLQSSSSSPLSLLSPSPLPSSSISSSSSGAEATTTAESESISTKSSASSSLQAAASSSLPSSIWTSTLEVLKNLANGSVSKLGEIDSRRNNSLKEAMRVFEDFIDTFMNITTPIKDQLNDGGEETRRESIFKVAVAFEEFALNYGKYHLNGTNPSTSITSQTMGEYVNTRIMTAAMNPKPEKLRRDAILKFRNLQVTAKIQKDERVPSVPDGFSEEGCHVDHSRSNSEETVCSCNHLTHFAVLVDFSGSTKLSENDVAILEIITYVGLSLSIIGILSTITLYSFLTDVRQPLSQIRVSLAVALGAGQIFFLSGINATENKAVCVIVAVTMQYLLMAAFCWMLVEGIYLYLFVVKVYNINTKMHMYHVMSWGFPLVMVAISLCIAAGKEGIQSYTSDKFCWISSANNLIWIFVTFVIAIEVINILILTRVIREITRMQPTGDQQSQQLRVGIRACMVMIPLLGITWLFGLLSPLHKAFSYIFTILNSTQGFLIFVLHCVRNSQIRERFKRKVNTVFPSTNNGNSAKRSSQVNPSDVGDTWVAELQSFNEFEEEKHSA
ncbi:unnamed protein product [Pocillopora meandrina]|uniref:G-protein coupled receptors family 2 profile 2 domain-containing protein n=1 Tax=Pocillopora meandrina TaxID=46732 RepID=A0AAU9XUF6_9CNID|nr:unnamed protein product [Pocillopora meandrina]